MLVVLCVLLSLLFVFAPMVGHWARMKEGIYVCVVDGCAHVHPSPLHAFLRTWIRMHAVFLLCVCYC